jgi:hypothetical protein
MATKNNPGEFDCYANALPDEPMFVLLARDKTFSGLVAEWARERRASILRGQHPDADIAKVQEAEACALAGERWRQENYGKWRKP